MSIRPSAIGHERFGCWLLAVMACASMSSMTPSGRASEAIQYVPPKSTEKPLRPNFSAEKNWAREELISESLKPVPKTPTAAAVYPEESSTAGISVVSRKERTEAPSGEPIRFVRARVDEKPLRYNFAAEKIHSREGLSAASFQPSTGGAAMSGGTVPGNRKARAAAVARRNWASSDKSEADAKSAQMAEASRAASASVESPDLDSAKPRVDRGMFSDELGLSPREPGSSQVGGAEGRNRGVISDFNADNRAALRGMLGESAGGAGAANASGLRGNLGAGFSTPGAFQSGASQSGGEARRDSAGGGLGGGAFAPRVGADPGFEGRAASPAPESRKPVFDPLDRPLRSNFELPTRTR